MPRMLFEARERGEGRSGRATKRDPASTKAPDQLAPSLNWIRSKDAASRSPEGVNCICDKHPECVAGVGGR